MSSDEISKMRGHVIEFYEKHLSNESFIKAFESRHEQVFTAMLHPKLVCSEAEEVKAKEFYNALQTALGINASQSDGTEKVSIQGN